MDSSIFKSLLLLSLFTTTLSLSSSSSPQSHLSSILSLCKSTPYPDTCFTSLKLSISIGIPPNIITYLLQSLQIALSEAQKLSGLFSNAGPGNIIEKQRGALQDCRDLHQITMASLKKSQSKISSKKLENARAYLSAALTNKNTCLEGLDSASGPLKSTLINSLISAYQHVSNSLSLLSHSYNSKMGNKNRRRRLMGFPEWVSRGNWRRFLQSEDDDDLSNELTVAKDGTGNFSTISEAINFAPNNSYDWVIIYVKEGVYEENVEIPSYKINIVLIGDGRDVTVITGGRSVGDGWTTFRSATVAVSGDGFLARDITFENSAGPSKHQAVALRINADLAALYRCTINGYQDTLYAHSFRQFYRECDIYGTIDYIFGNAAAVFQGCNIISKKPMPGQFTVITAQSRDSPDENTAFSIQNCSVITSDDYLNSSSNYKIKSYLGRPWRNYSRTVFIESYLDDFIDPSGWKEWSSDDQDSLATLYYGEYENDGPGSGTGARVTWPGYHVMDYYDASNFTVSELITGQEWLDSTSFPYDDGV